MEQKADVELERRLVFNVLQYLTDVTAGRTNMQVEDAEGLEVAVQCLSTAFGLDISNEEQKANYSTQPLSLPQVFGLGLAGKQQLEALTKAAPQQAATPYVSAIPPEQTEKFNAFLNVLKSRDFFKGSAEGTPEYEKRLRTAEERFLERPVQKQAAPSVSALEEADKLKNAGNAALTAREYRKAVDLYTQAIAINANNAVYFCNRAAAHSQLGEHKQAIADCNSAIQVDPKYSKAYSRLGFSLYALGRYEEAIKLGYEKCLELDPSNEMATESLRSAQLKIDEAKNVTTSQQQPSAAGAPGAGMDFGNLAQMFNTPEMQSAMGSLAQQFGGAANAGAASGGTPTSPSVGGMGGMPAAASTGGMPTGAPGGGMPNMNDLLGNPAMMNMAQQMMSSPAFSQILNNPAFMNMAQNLMQNPGALGDVLGSLNQGADATKEQ